MKDLTKLLADTEEIELEGLTIEAEEITLEMLAQRLVQKVAEKKMEQAVKDFTYTPVKDTYKGKILEVVLGAAKSDGGTRKNTITLGGHTTPQLFMFEGPPPKNKPIVSHDVFDIPFRLPSSVKKQVGDAINNPADWAKKNVKDFGAEMITLHLISTDPNWRGTSAKEAAKTVEDVLQAVNVPIIISGSGNYEKDAKVLSKAAEAASGEGALISSVAPEMDYKLVVAAAKEHNHVILTLVSLDIPGIKKMNKSVMREGLPPERIMMDPNTAALGYGIEYSISTMERIRLNALKGDKDLAMPVLAGAANAWSAREAWMKEESFGPREFRGPLWEAITATIALLSGSDLFMMLNPAAIKTVKGVIDSLYSKERKEVDYTRWVTEV